MMEEISKEPPPVGDMSFDRDPEGPPQAAPNKFQRPPPAPAIT